MSRQTGQIISKGPLKHLLRVYQGTNALGKRKYFNETFYGTENEAKARLANLVLLNETHPDELNNVTFEEAFNKLRKRKSGKIRTATQKRYNDLAEKYVLPHIGSQNVRNLRPTHSQAILDDMNEKGLSGSTMHQTAIVMRQVFKHCQLLGLTDRNPMDGVMVPNGPAAKEPKVLTHDQLNLFLLASSNHRHALLYWTLALTGMRLGEALALKWEDINGKYIHVRRSASFINKEWEFHPPKTKAGKRMVFIPALLDQKLRESQRGEQGELVFATEGMLPGPRGLYDSFKRLLAKYNLPPIRIHDLRHTHATLLLSAGVPTSLVRLRLGHAKESITTDVYSHVTTDMEQLLAAQVDEIMAFQKPVRTPTRTLNEGVTAQQYDG